MRPLARQARSAAPVILICVAVAFTWDQIIARLDPSSGQTSPVDAALIGVLMSLPLILESSALTQRARRLPFWGAVLLKTSVYVSALALIFLGMGLLLGWLDGKTLSDFAEALPQMLTQMALTFVLYLSIIFFRQLDRLLGPGVLLRYLTGRYHHPRREQRIFMFVDLKGSTALSERLSLEAYYGLVNDFFRDVSEPVLDSRGEIYEYVGDEVVISWKHADGVHDANCLTVFFEIEKAIWARSERYLTRYGAVPEFKAAVHSGEVIAAEMGDLKKEIAFHGEVLNVTARIQGQCNVLGRRLLVSGTLVDELELPPHLTAQSLGPVELRGIEAPVELVAFA